MFFLERVPFFSRDFRGSVRGPNWGLFCPAIRAFTGFWDEISSTVSKVLSDRKVPLNSRLMCYSTAVNGC